MIVCRLLFLIPLVSCWARAERDGSFTPQPAERYTTMARKSPFALATAPLPTPAPQPSFANNWYVAGIGRLGDEDFVTIKSRDASLLFSIFGHETHPSTGVSVASVNWSETVGKSTVILRKGTETAKLEFNEADLRKPPAATPNPASANTQSNPGNRLSDGSMPVPGGSSVPGATPGAPAMVTPPQKWRGPAPNTGSPGQTRRRVGTIPMPPPQ